jgi:hypothetical protein
MGTAGVLRSMVGFVKGCMTMMHNIPKMGLVGFFGRDYQRIFYTIRMCVSSWLQCNSIEFLEELEDLNFANSLIKDWLTDTTTVTLSMTDSGNINVRSLCNITRITFSKFRLCTTINSKRGDVNSRSYPSWSRELW